MNTQLHQQLGSIGMGLRRSYIDAHMNQPDQNPDFFEFAPENWIGVGGKRKQQLDFFAENYPLIGHGLCLSIGSPAPLNLSFLKEVKQFINDYQIKLYSDHLSYSGDEAQLYDLLPIPFTEEAVMHVADRIRIVQEMIECPFALENISFYMLAGAEMTELEFINAVFQESKCQMLLDVNNVYVNSQNHGYDPFDFIAHLNPEHIAYMHIAGHQRQSSSLIIDTHGEEIINPVWDLLKFAYERFGVTPTVLERDDQLPPFADILRELEQIKQIQRQVKQQLSSI